MKFLGAPQGAYMYILLRSGTRALFVPFLLSHSRREKVGGGGGGGVVQVIMCCMQRVEKYVHATV